MALSVSMLPVVYAAGTGSRSGSAGCSTSTTGSCAGYAICVVRLAPRERPVLAWRFGSTWTPSNRPEATLVTSLCAVMA